MSEVKVRDVKLGTRTVQFPSSYLQPLEDSNSLLDDVDALKNELHNKGYLYLKDFHDRKEVLNARKAVLEYIKSTGEEKIRLTHPLGDGVLQKGCGVGCIPSMEGKNEISHSEAIRAVIEGPRPFNFFRKLFGRDVRTLDYKWLRAVHHEAYTGAHVDNVYMSRGSKDLHTMWTPLGDLPVEMGVLAMCEGSNCLPGFRHFQETYGNMDADAINLNGTGWFTCDPYEITEKFGGQWKTTDFRAGDVMIFNMQTVHMSTCNMTEFARVSCDTRWQPADDVFDMRYMEDCVGSVKKYGLSTKDNEDADDKEPTIEVMRTRWGLQ
ncbi:uncharacterized protein LOC121382550 [Gigantopelta aegis]|uniref:uncharacterized protein LOC121382550 n=1 Tax=Gigantopelta aegis TaxID=1735272 RepID=UPI001B88DE3F|nr:uncharacterized protein LOC121382550 [Gigantopelta aegis]XP_041367941.1 uncharacterized protein LOC121382550 [Gigantopelta aegis]XP_041367942.1 uncharacterized protein LOC121382550 [Gigantopelta aegis]